MSAATVAKAPSAATLSEQFYQIDRSFKDEAYQEATRTSKQSTSEERATLSYYRAYCLYRLNRETECLDEITKNGDNSEKWQVLEAQCRYRLHQYSETTGLYQKLLKDVKEVANGEDSEASLLLTVNLLASYVSEDSNDESANLDKLMKDLGEPEDAYELAYNLACAYLLKEDYAKAEEMLVMTWAPVSYSDSGSDPSLTLASTLCKSELGVETDSDPELNWINAQLGYLRQLQGRTGEAAEIYEKIMRPVIGGMKNDVSVMATACNNLVSLRPKGSSLFDALKRIRLASKAESLESKLTSGQLRILGLNKSIAFSSRSKLSEARAVLSQLESQLGDNFTKSGAAAVGKAVTQYASGGEGKSEAVDTLKRWLASNGTSGDATFVRLSLAGLLAETPATRSEAAEMLAELGPEISMGRPEAVRQRFGAHAGDTPQDRDALRKEISEVLSFWEKRSSGEAAGVLRFTRFATIRSGAWTIRFADRYVADVATRNKFYEEAAKAWELYGTKVGDAGVSAISRVSAPSSKSLENASMLVERLVQRSPEAETIEDSIDDVDPEELEGMDVSVGSQKKRHRKRKPRYPKGFDPENPSAFKKPDPERWLPKHERSDYRRKMKKKQMQLMRGPQGVVPTDGENVKTGPSTAQLEVSTERQTQHQKRRKNQRKRNSERKRRVGHLLSAYYSRTDSEVGATIGYACIEGVLLGSEDCVNGSTVPLSTSLQSSQHALSREIRQLHQRVEEGTYNDYELLVQTCIPSTGILNTAKLASSDLPMDKMERITELAATRDLVDLVAELLMLDRTIASLGGNASEALQVYENAKAAVEAVPELRASPAISAVLIRSSRALVEIQRQMITKVGGVSQSPGCSVPESN
ncbi:Signal recognition particle core component [Perkinsus olseni]|uniref:Signal recognition particle subunit SRP72 n=1 Tax=Perkinsus olseni TaxID=32597 RepID=A0A7J6PLJ1_PEROL|nr:Signal recognition particle core component [Perkinsus olseni]